MKPDELSTFYHSLSPLEQDYWQQLITLFQLVNPLKPEKGAKVLILRARHISQTEGITQEEALAHIFKGASERTLRRMTLLQQCSLSNRTSEM